MEEKLKELVEAHSEWNISDQRYVLWKLIQYNAVGYYDESYHTSLLDAFERNKIVENFRLSTTFLYGNITNLGLEYYHFLGELQTIERL